MIWIIILLSSNTDKSDRALRWKEEVTKDRERLEGYQNDSLRLGIHRIRIAQPQAHSLAMPLSIGWEIFSEPERRLAISPTQPPHVCLR